MTTAALYQSNHPHTDRPSKAAYIADKYAPILHGRILDIGCDQKFIAPHLPEGTHYTGIDVAPPADIILNLDQPGATLPFPDAEFDTVLAADVLEHLERIHAIFDELCRVSACRVIISLPNPVRNLIDSFVHNQSGRLKFYGLPVDPPADRHRWFFGAEEAAHFLTQRAARNRFEVEQLDHESLGCPLWMRNSENLLASPNITAGTTWCVLKRL